MSDKALPIDMAYVQDVLLRLLRTPSPTGRTDEVMHVIGRELERLGIGFELTRRGALLATLPGEQQSPDRAIVVHSDTIGCMVKGIKENGRLQLVPIGTFSSRFAEGARCTVFADDPDRVYTGTILPIKASGHTFGDEIDVAKTGWEEVELRLDELTVSRAETEALGVQVGDFVALDAEPVITPTGFVKSRHLDDKAGVAAALGAAKAVIESDVVLPVCGHLLVTIAEEVGQGASHGLHADVAEMLSVDNAVVAPGQASTETGVSITMLDSAGPLDYHLTRKLWRLAQELGIEAHRDLYHYYRSDTAAAIEAGAETRAAQIGFGVDASHGYERTHLRAIEGVAQLVTAWLRTPLTFAEWDLERLGPLQQFPRQEDVEDAE
jgi:peptidase M42 family hydrolase